MNGYISIHRKRAGEDVVLSSEVVFSAYLCTPGERSYVHSCLPLATGYRKTHRHTLFIPDDRDQKTHSHSIVMIIIIIRTILQFFLLT